jgi:predicted dehydrogenase
VCSKLLLPPHPAEFDFIGKRLRQSSTGGNNWDNDSGKARANLSRVSDKQIIVGVVGLGAFGRHHARHYAANDGAALVAVADKDPARAEAAAAQFGAKPYADPLQLIGKVTAVSIATPASDHVRLAKEFIAAGVHVLVEKPLATSSADARALVVAAEAAGVVLQVGHIERFSPAIREIRRRAAGVRRITALRRSSWSERSADVDVVLDMMIHDIDHALSFAGAPVASVAASGAAVKGPLADEAEAWLTFTNGAIATLSASRVAERQERKLTVIDEERVFAADLAAPALAIAVRRSREPAEVATFAPHDNLAAEIAAFIRSVRTGEPAEADGHAGLAAVEIAERIQAAMADADLPLRRSV